MVQKARAPTRAFALLAPIVDPPARPGQRAAHPDDGHQSGEPALHRLSTGAHNLPVSPLDPPRPPVPVWRLRPAAPRRYDDGVSFGEENWGRSAIFTRFARILGPSDREDGAR
jgi:hypothetical protein